MHRHNGRGRLPRAGLDDASVVTPDEFNNGESSGDWRYGMGDVAASEMQMCDANFGHSPGRLEGDGALRVDVTQVIGSR